MTNTDPNNDQNDSDYSRPRTMEYIIYAIFGLIIILSIILLIMSLG